MRYKWIFYNEINIIFILEIVYFIPTQEGKTYCYRGISSKIEESNDDLFKQNYKSKI